MDNQTPTANPETLDRDVEAVRQLNQAYQRITVELSKVIVGQEQVENTQRGHAVRFLCST